MGRLSCRREREGHEGYVPANEYPPEHEKATRKAVFFWQEGSYSQLYLRHHTFCVHEYGCCCAPSFDSLFFQSLNGLRSKKPAANLVHSEAFQ
jgi:hypothetical protein